MVKVLTTGTIMVDILAVGLEGIARPGEIIYLDREIEARIGGHPIDVAIDLVKLGVDSGIVGVVAAVGKGLFGSYVKEIIENYKIKTFFQRSPEVDTGKNVVLEKKGEDRRFHIDPGINWYLDPDLVWWTIQKKKPKIFSLRPGYCGIDSKVEEIMKKAKREGSLVFLDIMKPHPKRPWDFLLPVIKYADAIHCNEKEAIAVTGKDKPEEALKELFQREGKIIFLTKGDRGAEVITEKVRILQPGFEIDFVDATGCGDAFCAGIIYKLLQWNRFRDVHKLSENQLCELLMMGQAVGASAATAAGCTEGVSKEKVDQILREQKEEILRKTIIRPGL